MGEVIRRFETDRAGVSRFHDVAWSEARRERQREFLDSARRELDARPFDALPTDARIDWTLLRMHIADQQAKLRLEERQAGEIEPLMPFRRDIQAVLLGMLRMEPVDAQAAAAMLSGIPDRAKSVREAVERGRKPEEPPPADGVAPARLPVTPVVALRASKALSSLRWQLSRWNEFHAGYVPEFSWWTRKPYDAAVGAIDELATYLREDIAGQKGKPDDPLVGDPIGEEALLSDLATEVIPYTPRELIAIGDRELAWCQEELRKAASEMGLDDWRRAVDKVKDLHEPPGGQDELVRQQSEFVIAWLKERDLVNIPPLCEETWRLKMITPEQQRTWPYAVYFGQAMGVSYARDDMAHEDKVMSMRGNNRHFTRIVTPHELIPGHHLQGYYEDRVRPYRRMFSTPFLVEGWALYWEMLLWDENYARGPEDRIGMLFWRTHRCARITVSLRFHLGEMSPPEMIDFLIRNVGHERMAATSEVRRYISGDYSPLYQCGYMIGGLQLRALARELVDSGRMTRREFNEGVLSQGPIPIELVRAAMLDQPPSRDHAASWRFMGDPDAPQNPASTGN